MKGRTYICRPDSRPVFACTQTHTYPSLSYSLSDRKLAETEWQGQVVLALVAIKLYIVEVLRPCKRGKRQRRLDRGARGSSPGSGKPFVNREYPTTTTTTNITITKSPRLQHYQYFPTTKSEVDFCRMQTSYGTYTFLRKYNISKMAKSLI